MVPNLFIDKESKKSKFKKLKWTNKNDEQFNCVKFKIEFYCSI